MNEAFWKGFQKPPRSCTQSPFWFLNDIVDGKVYASQVEEMISVSVTWTQDGVTYCLFSFNGSLTAKEMLQMAKEVAES